MSSHVSWRPGWGKRRDKSHKFIDYLRYLGSYTWFAVKSGNQKMPQTAARHYEVTITGRFKEDVVQNTFPGQPTASGIKGSNQPNEKAMRKRTFFSYRITPCITWRVRTGIQLAFIECPTNKPAWITKSPKHIFAEQMEKREGKSPRHRNEPGTAQAFR